MQAVAAEAGVPADNVLIQLSHTHSSVSLPRAVADPSCPGRAITLEWWETLKKEAAAAATSAVATMAPCWITAAEGSCDLAQKRDLWDRAADGTCQRVRRGGRRHDCAYGSSVLVGEPPPPPSPWLWRLTATHATLLRML